MAFITGSQYIPFEWAIVIFTLGVVMLRFFLRVRMGFAASWADLFIILAWFFFVLQASMDTALWRLGFFDNKIVFFTTDFGPEFGTATYANNVAALKLLYVENVLYYSEMYCVKWAMLCFYTQLFPRNLTTLRIALHATTVLTICGWASSAFMKVFLCEPISTNWIPGPEYCNTNGSHISNTYEWTFHVLTDVLIYILPMFLLHKLQLPLAQKVGIGATFGVGLGCILWANVFQVSILQSVAYSESWFYSVMEQMWALIVVCCPALKCLVNGRGFMKTLRGENSITRKSYTAESSKFSARRNTLLSNDNPERGTVIQLEGLSEEKLEGQIVNVTMSYELNTKTSNVTDKSETAVTATAWSAS